MARAQPWKTRRGTLLPLCSSGIPSGSLIRSEECVGTLVLQIESAPIDEWSLWNSVFVRLKNTAQPPTANPARGLATARGVDCHTTGKVEVRDGATEPQCAIASSSRNSKSHHRWSQSYRLGFAASIETSALRAAAHRRASGLWSSSSLTPAMTLDHV